jgi:hypothetical protein
LVANAAECYGSSPYHVILRHPTIRSTLQRSLILMKEYSNYYSSMNDDIYHPDPYTYRPANISHM